MAKGRPSFERACAAYVHRFTMDHIPDWARGPMPNGATGGKVAQAFYAPQYASDREWYESTRFPGEPGLHGNNRHCESGPPTWPLGQSLTQPFKRS